ncbi:unnamed protein product [Sympodiomycopsis kandeliae]
MLATSSRRRGAPSMLKLEPAKSKWVPRTFDKHPVPKNVSPCALAPPSGPRRFHEMTTPESRQQNGMKRTRIQPSLQEGEYLLALKILEYRSKFNEGEGDVANVKFKKKMVRFEIDGDEDNIQTSQDTSHNIWNVESPVRDARVSDVEEHGIELVFESDFWPSPAIPSAKERVRYPKTPQAPQASYHDSRHLFSWKVPARIAMPSLPNALHGSRQICSSTMTDAEQPCRDHHRPVSPIDGESLLPKKSRVNDRDRKFRHMALHRRLTVVIPKRAAFKGLQVELSSAVVSNESHYPLDV